MTDPAPDARPEPSPRGLGWFGHPAIWSLPFLLTPLLPQLYEFAARAFGASGSSAAYPLITWFGLAVGALVDTGGAAAILVVLWAFGAPLVHLHARRPRSALAHAAALALMAALPALMPLAEWLRFKLAEPGYRTLLAATGTRCWLDDAPHRRPNVKRPPSRTPIPIHFVHTPEGPGSPDAPFASVRGAPGCRSLPVPARVEPLGGDFYRVTSR